DDPVVRFHHLVGAFHVAPFVDVPQRGAAEIDEEHQSADADEQDIMPATVMKAIDHSLILAFGYCPAKVVQTRRHIIKQCEISARPSGAAGWDMTKHLSVGLDVGGTNMKAGVVDDAGKPLAHVSLPTEPHLGQEVGLERMCDAIREAMVAAGVKARDIAAIGV